MSDPYAADDQDRQFLWICFLSLFIILFSCSLIVLLSRACCFCERYCICQWKWCGCCCVVDIEGYRRERQHLHRLRELRQQRDFEIAHLATFTQIPGPIPDSYGFRELRRQTAIRDLTSLGFIVVTPQGAHSSASQTDVNSLEMRNHLSTEQRRDILERLLSCRVRMIWNAWMRNVSLLGINKWNVILFSNDDVLFHSLLVIDISCRRARFCTTRNDWR